MYLKLLEAAEKILLSVICFVERRILEVKRNPDPYV